jgi:hypothetical protein
MLIFILKEAISSWRRNCVPRLISMTKIVDPELCYTPGGSDLNLTFVIEEALRATSVSGAEIVDGWVSHSR